MGTRTATTPEQRLAKRLTACYEKPGALSYRELEEVVAEAVGSNRSVSYETIRKYHTGEQPWGSIRVEVVKVLARVYGKTLRQLSPELADVDELRRFSYAPRDSNPEPAEYGDEQTARSAAFSANVAGHSQIQAA